MTTGFEAGLWQAHLVVNGEYFLESNDADRRNRLRHRTEYAAGVPRIQRVSKIDVLWIKLTVPETHGISSYAVLGTYTVAVLQPRSGRTSCSKQILRTGDQGVFRSITTKAFQPVDDLQYQPSSAIPGMALRTDTRADCVAGNARLQPRTTWHRALRI